MQRHQKGRRSYSNHRQQHREGDKPAVRNIVARNFFRLMRETETASRHHEGGPASQQCPDHNHAWPECFVSGLITKKSATPSSSLTRLNTLQLMHVISLWAKVPCTFHPQNVPATAQQILPPFVPPFNPCAEVSDAAGQIPASSSAGPRPQLHNSQQLLFGIYRAPP